MHQTTKEVLNGKLQYKKKMYSIFNAPLNDELIQKLEDYDGDKKWIDHAAPWKPLPLIWELEDDKLYLVKLYTEGLLEELIHTDRYFASWVERLDLLLDEKMICKIEEDNQGYLKEQNRLHLTFDKGVLVSEEEETVIYRTAEHKNNTERHAAYATCRMSSNNLLIYLEDKIQDEEDQLLSMFSDFIELIIDDNDEISLDRDELKEVLESGETVYLASVKGKDIDTMVSSLISTLTHEGLSIIKGCLLHLEVHKKYPRKSIIQIIEKIDEGFNFNYEPLKPELIAPYYTGTRFNWHLDEKTVSIMILVTI